MFPSTPHIRMGNGPTPKATTVTGRGECLLLVVAVPVLTIIFALLPPLGFFAVSWLIWTLYFFRRE